MRAAWETRLDRWIQAGLIDPATAERVRAFEASQVEGQKLRWPILLALAFGGLLLGAGVLLFVAAHWDDLSPSNRFLLVLLLVAVFHIGGALAAERFSVLATVLHAVGTASLGAGIFLAGQIFNLQEHWPGGLMLWALGAWVGWWLLGDAAQATFAAVLTPAWLAGEWTVATEWTRGSERILLQGLLLLALTYLSARTAEESGAARRVLVWVGGLALLPFAFIVVQSGESFFDNGRGNLSASLRLLGWSCAYGLPLLLALWLRRRAAWANFVAAGWVWTLGAIAWMHESPVESLTHYGWRMLGPYFWGGLGSVALVGWGLYEARRERINFGVAGFALTVLTFYFSDVMDKLGRSASLIGLGLIFLVGGWALERTRRRLVARIGGSGR